MINLLDVAQDLYEDINLPQTNGGANAQGHPALADNPGLQTTTKAETAAILSRPLGYKSGTIFRFDHADSDSNYITSPDGTIKACSSSKLIEKLTNKNTDPNLLFEFLLTYRSICTPLELLDGLVQSTFTTAMGPDRDVVRLRVVNVFKTWIDKHWNDFSKEEILGITFEEFVGYLTSLSGMDRPADSLKKSYEKRKTAGLDEERERQFSATPPKPIIPAQMPTMGLDILEIHPEELARQLTLIEYEYYRKIRPWECLAWNKKNKDVLAPNIVAAIGRFNEVSNWVASEIVRQENLKKRVKVLQKFIEVAEKLNKPYNNFNAVMEIIAALGSSSIHRLKQTFSALPQRTTATFNELYDLVQRGPQNFQKLRNAIHSCSPPCIPYLGMYLTDLTFIEDGNKDTTEAGLINFFKRRQIANVIREIIQYQQTPYCLEPVAPIQDYLRKLTYFDEDTNYKLSNYLEPKPGQMRPSEKPIELMTPEELKAAGLSPASASPPGANGPSSPKPTPTVPSDEYDAEFIQSYKFYSRDGPENIAFEEKDGNHIVHLATVEKLVERLTYDKSTMDTQFTNTFLATFRSFLLPQHLLDLLIMRWNIPLPKQQTPDNMEKYRNKEMPIRLRLFSFVKTWIERHFTDFRDDPPLLDRLQVFINTIILPVNAKWASTLQATLQKAAVMLYSQLSPGNTTPKEPPPPIQAKPLNEIGIHELDSAEVAKQLTLLAHQYYIRIRPVEMSGRRWAQSNAHELAPNILAFNGLQDKFGYNIEIELSKLLDRPAELTTALAKWIDVAEQLAVISSWPTVRTILITVQRLYTKELLVSWQSIPLTLKQQFLDLSRTCTDRGLLRSRVSATIPPPAMPVLDLYLEDLAQIEEKVPAKASDVLINFDKCQAMADILTVVQTFQRYEFLFGPSDIIRRWLLREPARNELPAVLASQKFPQRLSITPTELLANPPPIARPTPAVAPAKAPITTPAGGPAKLKATASASAFNPSPAKLIVSGSTLGPPAPSKAGTAPPSANVTVSFSPSMLNASASFTAPPTVSVSGGISPHQSSLPNMSSSASDLSALLLDDDKKEQRATFRTLLRTSPEFRDEVVAIMLEIAREQTARIQRDFLLDKEANQNNASSALSEFYQIIKREFPGYKLSRWSYNDQQGAVYGFPEIVECDVIQSPNATFLCEIRPEVLVQNVALLLRIGRLYKSLNPKGALACVILTKKISPQALSIANRSKIKIFGLERAEVRR